MRHWPPIIMRGLHEREIKGVSEGQRSSVRRGKGVLRKLHLSRPGAKKSDEEGIKAFWKMLNLQGFARSLARSLFSSSGGV